MKPKLATVLAVVLLAGCGATIKASSPRSVVVHAVGVASAQPLADAECAKHKRYAQFVGETSGFNFTFQCVE